MPLNPTGNSGTHQAEAALEEFLRPGELENPLRRRAAGRLVGLLGALSSESKADLERALDRDEGLRALYAEETENADRALPSQSDRALRSSLTRGEHAAVRDRFLALASEYGINDLSTHDRRFEPRDSGGMPVPGLRDLGAADTAKDALDRFLLPGELDHPDRRKAAVDLAECIHELPREDERRLEHELNSSTVLSAIYQDAQASVSRRNQSGISNALQDPYRAAATEQLLRTAGANPATSRGPRPVIPVVQTNRRGAPTSSEQPGDRTPPEAERRFEWQRPRDEFRPGPPAPPTLLRQDAFHVPNGDRPATPGRMPPDRQLSDRRRDGGDRGV